MKLRVCIVACAVLALAVASGSGCAKFNAFMGYPDPRDAGVYPYQGALVETNGVPINPPRW